MADYPSSITTLATRFSGQKVAPSHFNLIHDEVEAIETEAGILPKGEFSTVASVIDQFDFNYRVYTGQSTTAGYVVEQMDDGTVQTGAGGSLFGNFGSVTALTLSGTSSVTIN